MQFLFSLLYGTLIRLYGFQINNKVLQFLNIYIYIIFELRDLFSLFLQIIDLFKENIILNKVYSYKREKVRSINYSNRFSLFFCKLLILSKKILFSIKYILINREREVRSINYPNRFSLFFCKLLIFLKKILLILSKKILLILSKKIL